MRTHGLFLLLLLPFLDRKAARGEPSPLWSWVAYGALLYVVVLTVPSQSLRDFKKKMAAPTAFSPAEFDAINRDIWDLRVATLGEEKAREKSVEDGKRSPVEIY